jgi:hypothetical protein
MTPAARWIASVREQPILVIATALGHVTQPARGASGGSIVGCPACAAGRRHPSRRDRRGAIGVRRDGRGWCCHECQTTGDGLDLIAWTLCGRRCSELTEQQLAEMRTWCRERLHAGAEPAPQRAVREEPAAPPSYPPNAEITSLHDRCLRVDEVPEVGNCLQSRSIDPGKVADLDLARALPATAELPAWASRWDLDLKRRVNWIESGHRLIVPLFDERGLMRSLLARCIRPHEVKSLAPSSYERRGLLMADGLARQILTHAARPDWWPEHRELRIIVGEGEPDHLTLASGWSEADECAPATLSVVAGGWTAEFTRRIPNRADVVVVVATHSDAAGDRYADAIIQSFAGLNVRLERKHWREPEAAQ